MSEKKEIHRKIGDSNVTITFKGYNPDIKDSILDMLCNSFEERIMQQSVKEQEGIGKETPKEIKENRIVSAAPSPVKEKRRRSRAR